MQFVDLHIHSHFSMDGEWTPAQIVNEAAAVGAGAISISDHDTVEAVAVAGKLAAAAGLELIPSVEISTSHHGKDYHLLAPYVDSAHRDLHALLNNQRPGRAARAQERIRKLQEHGFDVDYEAVVAYQGSTEPNGPAIAGAIFHFNRPANADMLAPFRAEASPEGAFYRAFFNPGKPAFVPIREAPLDEAIRLVKGLGGVPVLAHPGARFIQASFETVSELKSIGLEGLEVYSSYHDDANTSMYESWARDLALVATAGSDFHGRMKPQVGFGSMRQRGMDILDELRARREQS